MSDALVPCSACARHVRVTSARCPFCDAAITDAPACAEVDDGLARGHTARRAGVAVAVSLAAGFSLAACYGGPPRPPTYRQNDAQRSQQLQQPPPSQPTGGGSN